MSASYPSGEPIEAGDRIRYHGEQGYVEFVVAERGDPAFDWYRDQFPGGGAMIVADGFGSVFLGVEDVGDGFLELVARRTPSTP